MKINRKIGGIICAALITAGVIAGISSCKKGSSANSTSTTDSFTEADAAELSTDALVPSTGGMVTSVSNSTGIYQAAALSCGVEKDSTIVKASAPGLSPSYDYNLSWNYTLTCKGLVPNQLTFNFTGSGDYDGPRMSSSDKSTGGFVLKGLGVTAGQYILNTTYTRVGTTTSKILNKNTFASTITITSTNILIDKISQEITSGSATITIKVVSTSGRIFNFNGTVTFLGNKTATIVLNSGTSYNIQWS
jgi:hypothetical protein